MVQMAANVPRSSADNELFGLPGRTNACVPLSIYSRGKKEKNNLTNNQNAGFKQGEESNKMRHLFLI